MADLNPLSSKLKSFHDVYSSISGMKTTQTSISESLDGVSEQIETAIDGVSAASSDSQANQAKSCLILANDAVKSVKTHVNGDLTALFNNCDEVEDLVKKILEKIEEGKAWNPGWWERVWNDFKGFFCDEWRSGDSAKIAQANKEIDRWNKEGEAQLDSMSSAINSVKFGVIGNMTVGGSLGASVAYSDNYSFNATEWEAANPIYSSNFFTRTGSLVLGGVEGVGKVVEGVLDYGTTAVASVVSVFVPNAGKAIADFAARDLVGSAADSISDVLGLHDDEYRGFGKGLGSMVAHGALWMTGAGAVVSAVSIAGNSSESYLQSNGTDSSGKILGALGIGTVTGLTSYALGHAGKAVAQKFGTWVTGKGSATVVGRAYSSLSKTVGTSFGKGWTAGIKGSNKAATVVKGAINIAASPARGIGHMMTGGAKMISGSKLAKTSMWQRMGKLDAKADALSSKIVNKATGVFGKVGSGVKNHFSNTGKTQANGSGTNANASTGGNTNNGGANANASTGGNTNNVGANANASAGGKVSDSYSLGLPDLKSGETPMTYNQAQRDLKMLDDAYYALRLDEAASNPALAHDLGIYDNAFQTDTANVANSLFGKTGVTLNQDGNWYQNAENAAKYFGQQGIVNTPEGFNNFATNVYGIGRVDVPASLENGVIPIRPTSEGTISGNNRGAKVDVSAEGNTINNYGFAGGLVADAHSEKSN